MSTIAELFSEAILGNPTDPNKKPERQKAVDAFTALADGVVYSSLFETPVNPNPLYISDTGWNPIDDHVYGRSTPQNALIGVGGHYYEDGGATVNYLWGISGWMSNGNTAPLTVADFTAQGWKVRGIGATARQMGSGGDGHAIEVLAGQWASSYRITTVNASATVSVLTPLLDGSRISVGDAISGSSNIQAATVVTSVTKGSRTWTGQMAASCVENAGGTGYAVGNELTMVGGTRTFPTKVLVRSVSSGVVTSVTVSDPGNYTVLPSFPAATTGGAGTGCTITPEMIAGGDAKPDSIVMSKTATGSSALVTLTVLQSTCLMVGILMSGSGAGGADGTGNPNGHGIRFASYGSAKWKYPISFGSVAVRTDGACIYMDGVVAAGAMGMLVESSTLEDVIKVAGGNYAHFENLSNGTYSAAAHVMSGVTATYGYDIRGTNTFSGGAAFLLGAGIHFRMATTGAGTQFATAANQLIGFHGAAATAQGAAITSPSGGATQDTQARTAIDAIRAFLTTKGLTA